MRGKRVLSGLVLVSLAALLAASPSVEARKFSWPSIGYQVYDSDSTVFADNDGELIDSLQAPAGYLLSYLVVRHNSVSSEKLLLGYVPVAHTGDGDTSEVSQWFYLHDSGNTGDLGDTYEFHGTAEKVYIKAATATGSWSWDAYYVYVGGDSTGIYGVTWP